MMKRFLVATTLAAACVPALAADVGVSVSVAQPGLYGRVDVSNFPPPPVLYPQPVVIQPAAVAAVRQPIYLHVPPGHARKWEKHCRKYGACGQPVYFVQERWYNEVYVAHYRDHDRGERKRGKGRGRGRDD